MHAGILIIDFHLEGCRSLKEKRRRLSGLRSYFGKQFNVAVCENDFQDIHQRAQWSFVALSADKNVVTKILDSIEKSVDEKIDALVINIHRDFLM